MKKSNLSCLLLILPLILSCSFLNSITNDEVDLPENIESAYNDPEILDRGAVVATVKDDKGFYIDDNLLSFDKASDWLTPLVSKTRPEKRLIYLKVSKEIEIRAVIEFIKEVRKADVKTLAFVVRNKTEPNKLSALRVSLDNDKSRIGKKDPFKLLVSMEENNVLKLNSESISEEKLVEELEKAFKWREDNGVFLENTSQVNKTVIVNPSPGIQYENVIKIIDKIKSAGAEPLELQIDDQN